MLVKIKVFQPTCSLENGSPHRFLAKLVSANDNGTPTNWILQKGGQEGPLQARNVPLHHLVAAREAHCGITAAFNLDLNVTKQNDVYKNVP